MKTHEGKTCFMFAYYGLQLCFHPFLCYLFGFIFMIYGKSRDTYFFGLI